MTILRLTCLSLLMLAFSFDGAAQSRRSDTARPSRLSVVEEEVKALRRQLADMSVKISVLEREVRSKTGQMEEAEYRNRELQELVEQLQQQVLLLSSDLRQLQTAGPVKAGSAPLGAPSQSQIPQDEEQVPAEEESITLPEGTAAEQFDFAFKYVRANDLDTGGQLLADVIAANKGDAVTGNAYYWLGRINLQQGRPAEAARNLLLLLDEFPNHAKRAESYVDLAAALIALDVKDEACDALYEFERLDGTKSPRLVSRGKQLAAEASCQ